MSESNFALSSTTPILIHSTITLLGILLTAFLTYYFSKRRYKFEKTFDRKLLYLEKIYSKIVSLEKNLKIYILTTGADTRNESLSERKKELPLIQAKFLNLQKYFQKKEIVLNEDLTSVIQSFINELNKILSNLSVSNTLISLGNSDISEQEYNKAFEGIKNKLPEIKKQLKKEFKKILES